MLIHFHFQCHNHNHHHPDLLTGAEHFVDGTGQGPIITIFYLFVLDYFYVVGTSF